MRRFYDTVRWRRERLNHLKSNPLCVMCLRMGRTTQATVVDHIEPHKGNEELFWDRNNWQSLCTPCHDSAKKHYENKGYSQGCDVDGFPIDRDHPFNKGKMND